MSRDIKFNFWLHDDESFCGWEQACSSMVGLAYFMTSDRVDKLQYTGLKDVNGTEIYAGDVVYINGYGDYIAEFPFLELYDSVMEGDIGEIKGNIHQNPEMGKYNA